MYGLSSKTLEEIKNQLQKIAQIDEAVLFGSRALGNYKQGSDVDIAIKGNIDMHSVQALSYALNEQTNEPYFFDIVDYEHLDNQALKEHIDHYGVELYKVNI